MVKTLDSQSGGAGFKTSAWIQGRLSPHPVKVDETSTMYSWEPKGKKWTVSF